VCPGLVHVVFGRGLFVVVSFLVDGRADTGNRSRTVIPRALASVCKVATVGETVPISILRMLE
jgi:hypothetical protein